MEKISEKLPNEYKEQMQGLLKGDFDKYLNALNQSPVRGVRVNTKRIAVKDFLNSSEIGQNATEIGYADDGFVFDDEEKWGNSVEHLTGQIYFQEPCAYYHLSLK